MAVNIMLVDDDPDMLAGLAALIGSFAPEATIHSFPDGARALAALKRIQPDLVVTDLQMPYLGGRDFTSMVHQLDSRAKVIVLSGASSERLAEAARLPNVVAALSKPPDVAALRAAIRSILKDSRPAAT